MPNAYVEFAVVGGLREDYVIYPTGESFTGVPGGNALYAAVGARVWSKAVGLCTRVGNNYPSEWLEKMEKRGIDTTGVKVMPAPLDTRTFYAYLTLEERADTDPAQHFARFGQSLPPALEGYVASTRADDRVSFSPHAARPTEVPAHYLNARGFHLAPDDYLLHNSLPPQLRLHKINYITCDPSVRYMVPEAAEDVKKLVKGLTAFLPSEMEVRSFMGDSAKNLWEAAEAFGAMGTKCVVIKCGSRGQLVYDVEAKRKWQVPAYPARVRDVTGAGDAYCGGFLVGLTNTHDPLEAALHGAIAASLVLEGPGAFYALDSSTTLAEARLEALRAQVRPI